MSESFECPKCGEKLTMAHVPKLKDTCLTMAIKLEKGHMLQAETLGETLTSLAKLLKAQAKQLGGKVTVGVKDLRVAAPDQIEIEVAVLANISE